MASDSSVDGSSRASMRKWGIPDQKAPEITLLERLVWVQYKSFWWPAVLYHSYSELQNHLYDQLDTVLKAQFTVAIMRELQEKRSHKIARLLGRILLEVVEVKKGSYCEFYRHLPKILPHACDRRIYGDNEKLYLDFHRALDHVEDIIREVSQQQFALLPSSDQTSWLQRAQGTTSVSGGSHHNNRTEIDDSTIIDSVGGVYHSNVPDDSTHTRDVSVWSSKQADNGVEIRLKQADPKGLQKGDDASFRTRNSLSSRSIRTDLGVVGGGSRSTHLSRDRMSQRRRPMDEFSLSTLDETDSMTPSVTSSLLFGHRRIPHNGSYNGSCKSKANTEIMDNRTNQAVHLPPRLDGPGRPPMPIASPSVRSTRNLDEVMERMWDSRDDPNSYPFSDSSIVSNLPEIASQPISSANTRKMDPETIATGLESKHFEYNSFSSAESMTPRFSSSESFTTQEQAERLIRSSREPEFEPPPTLWQFMTSCNGDYS